MLSITLGQWQLGWGWGTNRLRGPTSHEKRRGDTGYRWRRMGSAGTVAGFVYFFFSVLTPHSRRGKGFLENRLAYCRCGGKETNAMGPSYFCMLDEGILY